VLILALTDAQKAGIAGMGAAFIIFALISSFVLTRKWPNFPGRYVWAYVGVVVVFFLGMMSVIVFAAKEPPEASAESTTPTTTSPAPPPPSAPPPPAGNAAAGKAVFLAPTSQCAGCHTFKPAGSTGKIGPDLDNLASDAQKANRGSLAQYIHESIVDPNAYIVPGFQAGLMPQTFGKMFKAQQLADLVAFLSKPS
jgi:mono/diheme cytochrome c family protein